MSSTSGGYSRQLRLFLGRSIRMKSKRLDESDSKTTTGDKSANNCGNCKQTTAEDEDKKQKKTQSSTKKKKDKSVGASAGAVTTTHTDGPNVLKFNRNNCTKDSNNKFNSNNSCNTNNTDNNSNANDWQQKNSDYYLVVEQQNQQKFDSFLANKGCVGGDVIRLRLQQQQQQQLQHRYCQPNQRQSSHRRSYSLNDLSLLYDLFDGKDEEFTGEEDYGDYRYQNSSIKTGSRFRRTLSYLSGKSLIRRRKLKAKRMGQNSSSTNTTTSEVNNMSAAASVVSPTAGNTGGSTTAGLALKADKQKDYCNSDELTQLKDELRATKLQLYDRDQQLLKLHREIHKMKSVLEQTSLAIKNSAKSSVGSLVTATGPAAGPTKKCGVSGECFSASASVAAVQKVSKDNRSKQLIKEALLDNSFLRHFLDTHQLKLIVDAMYEKEFSRNCLICKQGTYGSHLYVIAYGHCEIIDNKNTLVNQLGPGKAFGELALLYNCTRTATVKALTKVRTWVLDRRAFQMIMMKTGKDKNQQYRQFLQSVPLLQNLNEELIGRITDAIEVDYYPAGDYICRQGCSGDSFYIIASGSVKVTQHNFVGEETLRTLKTGDYFGEQALLVTSNSALRTANVVSLDCECLVLDRTNFHSLIGDLNELKTKYYEDRDVFHCMESSESGDTEGIDPSVIDLKLDDLESVTTLGIGGFGKVDLVRVRHKRSQVFALKSCAKAFVRSTRQEQHINNERIVQRVASRHQFVVKLYRTFKDDQSVYFLLEAALGGELWTLLRHRGAFEEISARFYVGCVVEALQYLHSHQIIYRDLKPENCLLDKTGYLKITDFGFSKLLCAGEKTWTFCGTPEYVAPEIILNKGHDQAVDFWSIGILLYELLTGMPPFTSPDPLKTYNIILRGFDAIGFEEAIFSKNCVNLIRRLCKENPSERIGVQKNGYSELKSHKWFSGFDWDQLIRRAIKPPIVPRLNSSTDTHYFDVTPDQTLKEAEFDVKDNSCDLDTDCDQSWDKYF